MARKTYTLVLSTTDGCYALNKPQGRDLAVGDTIAIWLNGTWIEGSVGYNDGIHATESFGVVPGWYFLGTYGGYCGLCVGMTVSLL